MDYRSFVGLAGAPLILALVQLVKRTWPELSPRYEPALVLGLAVALNLALAWQLRTDLGLAVLVGIVTGLSASGLYTQAAALTRG